MLMIFAAWVTTITKRGGANVGDFSHKIHFFWNAKQELFSNYSTLQGRARIQALIKSTPTLFFFSLQPQLLPAEKYNGEQ